MCTAEVERAVRRDDPRARGSVCDGRIRVVDGDVLLRGSATDETSKQGGADDGVEDHGGTLQTADRSVLEELEPSSSCAKHSSVYVIPPPHEAIVLCDEELKKKIPDR